MLVKLGNTIPVIKVIGVGGFGKQTVLEMMATKRFTDIEFLTISPGKEDVAAAEAVVNISLSKKADSLSSEDSYKSWEILALESKESIRENLKDADIVFISCNEGRGFSTGVAPIIANIASECGALVIAVATMPFKLEGKKRMQMAEKGVELLKKSAGTTIVVNKQRMFENIVKGTLLTKAYGNVKAPLYQSIEIITRIIRVAEHINIDLADLRLIMSNSGLGFIGEGVGESRERTKQAIEQALSFPLTDNSIDKAKNILFNITGSKDLEMGEIEDIAQNITKSIHKDANIKFGVTIDEEMKGKIKVTVIATSMEQEKLISAKNMLSAMTDYDIPTYLRNGN